MPSSAPILRIVCLVWLILATWTGPRPAVAQTGDSEFADLAAASFGMACLFLMPDDLDDAARILGLTRLNDAALVARMMPGGPARGWSMLHTGRVLMLARREQDGACLLDVLSIDESLFFAAVDRLLRRLHGGRFQMAEEEEVPRGFPRPPLRARYRLTTPEGGVLLVQFFAERHPTLGPQLQVLLVRG